MSAHVERLRFGHRCNPSSWLRYEFLAGNGRNSPVLPNEKGSPSIPIIHLNNPQGELRVANPS